MSFLKSSFAVCNLKMKKQAFTFIELMMVIVIIGIMAGLAIPNYRASVNKAKFAEAYRILATMVKNELTYYYQFNEFYDLTPMPTSLDVPMLITTNSSWSLIGYPATVGSNVNFSYRARAGKTDNTGTQLTTSTVNGNTLVRITNSTILESSYTTPAVTCNNAFATPSSLGVLTQSSYDWVVLTAVGDLKGNRDTSCTAIALVVDNAGYNPGTRGGFIIFREGN